jgi:hypothetical protein
LIICRTDEQKADWQYVLHFQSEAGDKPENAPAAKVPLRSSFEKLALSVFGKYDKGALGIRVDCRAGDFWLMDIRKAGKQVAGHLAILDTSGKEVASKTAPLSAFGSS